MNEHTRIFKCNPPEPADPQFQIQYGRPPFNYVK